MASEKPQWTDRLPGTGMRWASTRRKEKEEKAIHESDPGGRQNCPLASSLDPPASAFFSLLCLLQAGLAMSASGPLGLATCLDALS